LWVGALVAFAIGLAHSILGERSLLIRLFRRGNLPKLLGSEAYTRRTIRFAWHITTLAWWGFGAQMAYAAGAGVSAEGAIYLRILTLTFGASALVSFLASRGRHYSWIAFLAIAACAWWGA
jgi:hypothetical protein